MALARLLPFLVTLGLLAALAGCNDSQVGSNNSAPEATIELPSVGTEVLEGRDATFRGIVEDRGTAVLELEVRWTSSIDGVLSAEAADAEGVTEFTTRDLSAGTHIVTLLVRDGAGASDEDTVELLVRPNEPPGITIQSPTTEGVYYSNLPVTLQASVSDIEDLPEDLRVSWAVDGAGTLAVDLAPDSTGYSTTSTTLSEGTYVLVATAKDTSERTATDTITFDVGPPNTPPTCEIVAPESGSSTPVGGLVILEGFVTDIDVPADYLEVSFNSSVDGPLGDALASSSGEVALPTSSLSSGTHSITMNVADEVGGTCSDFIILTMSNPPTAVITTPTGGETYNDVDTISLAGTVQDNEDASNTLAAEWSSNLDGSLGASSPDSAGAVARSISGLSAGSHLLTLTATDSMGLTGTDTVAIDVNASPTAPIVSISPTSPANDDPLGVNLDGPSTDADGGPSPITYAYTWTRNGNPMPAYAGLIAIPATDTSTTDTWAVEVTATDGLATSAAGSASVTVVNSPPSVGSVTITPSVGLSTDTFTCVPAGWYDADGDSESYSYQWAAGGAYVGGATSSTYVPTGQPAGTQITCEVTPLDAGGPGTPLISAASAINTPPSVTGVTLTPGAATEATTLTAGYGGTNDADGQTVTVSLQWNVGGAPLAGATGSTLDGSSFDAGDVITVTATPNDSLEDGSPVNSSAVTIANTPPSISSVSVSPGAGTETTTFTCLPSGWSDPDPADTTPGYLWQWTVSGSPSVTSQSISGASFSRGDVLACTATPDDGEATGTPVSSGAVTVGNTPPSISSVTISPASGTETTTFTCVPGGWSDGDGDPEGSYTYQWYVGAASSVTTASIGGASFDKGDVLSCEAVPFDGNDAGAPVASATVTVQNTAPSFSSVSISPGSGSEATTFTCTPAGWNDPDPADSSPSYSFLWTVAGSPSVTTQTITGANFDKGDVVTCTATPWDGQAAGTPMTSTSVLIANTPPSFSSVSISPGSGSEATTFTCTPAGWSDPDPADASPAYTWLWTVAGSPSVTTQSINGASFSRGNTLACTATPTDGAATGSPITSSVVTVDNTPPAITSVSVSPTTGTEATTFTCTPSGWSDADGDPPGTYTYQWFAGTTATATTATISGTFFNKGDALSCQATPFDDSDSGSPVGSNAVTVQNTAPSISGVNVNPSAGYETTTFSCVPTGWSDPDPADATPGYTWQWTVGGSTSVTSQTIEGSNFNRNDSLVCTATPTDGTNAGSPATSGAVVVANSPPSVASVSITPTTAYTNTTLTATPSGWVDADGDPPDYLYEWFAGTSPVGTDSPTLSGSEFSKGQVITVEVTPNDPSSSGTSATSAGVTILNTPPTAPVVTVTPQTPSYADDLNCAVTTPSTDVDNDTVTYTYSWLVGGSPSGDTGATLPSSATSVQEVWTCEATPYDGAVDGPVGDDAVTVSTLQINWNLYWTHPLSSQPASSTVLNYGQTQAVVVVSGRPCWRQTGGLASAATAAALQIDPLTPSANFIAYEVDAYWWGSSSNTTGAAMEFYPRTTSFAGIAVQYDSATSHLRYKQEDWIDITTFYGRDNAAPLEEVLDWWSGPITNSWFTIRVEVNLATNTATLFEDGVEAGTYAVTPEFVSGEYVTLRTAAPIGYSASTCWSNLRVYEGTPAP